MLHVAEGLMYKIQRVSSTEEQQENARKRMEANLRETTQQQIERELFTSLLKVLTGPLSLSLQILLFTYAHTQAVREYGTGITYLLVLIISQEFISTDDDDAIVASLRVWRIVSRSIWPSWRLQRPFPRPSRHVSKNIPQIRLLGPFQA
jgi:hypothetical protein